MNSMNKCFICAMLLCMCLFLFALVGCDGVPGKEQVHEHTIVEHEGQDPTCTKDGWRPYKTCSTCNEYSTYSKIDALGHRYSTEYTPNG